MTQLEDIGLERPSRWGWLKEMFRRDAEVEHIICTCRPRVNFCGRYEELAADQVTPLDGSECPECLRVLAESGCPNCGCDTSRCCVKCCAEGWLP